MENIEVFNWTRIALNEMPVSYLLEIAFRTAVVFILGLFFIRLIGRKTVGQLSGFEFLIIIMWGTVIGDPTFYEDVAILWCAVVLSVGAIMYRILNFYMKKYPQAESFVEGKTLKIIENGVIDKDTLKRVSLSHRDIMSLLRLKQIRSLGEIQKAYIERSGKLSIFKLEISQLGLPTFPLLTGELEKYKSGEKVQETGDYSSSISGRTVKFEKDSTFPPTESGRWVRSI